MCYEIQHKLLRLFPVQLRPLQFIVSNGFNVLQSGSKKDQLLLCLSLFCYLFYLLSFLSNLRRMKLELFFLFASFPFKIGQKLKAGCFLCQPQSPGCSANIPACVAHTVFKNCHYCYTCWIKSGLNATFWLLTWHSNWRAQEKWNTCNEYVAFFVCFQCRSRRSCTGIHPWPTPGSQCVVLPITENHYTGGDKQLIITRLYMPIRLSILESIFICHHICILIADERNWILNLLAPSEGKQSRRVY